MDTQYVGDSLIWGGWASVELTAAELIYSLLQAKRGGAIEFAVANYLGDTPPTDATPEPSTMVLMGLGVLGVACLQRRARHA